MRYVFALLILSLSTFVFIGCQQASSKSTANNHSINPTPIPDDAKRIALKDAKDAYDAGSAVLVDTRPANAYNYEHVKGSLNIPAAELENRIGELPKDKQIIFYCS